jgi:hypothetical protein
VKHLGLEPGLAATGAIRGQCVFDVSPLWNVVAAHLNATLISVEGGFRGERDLREAMKVLAEYDKCRGRKTGIRDRRAEGRKSAIVGRAGRHYRGVTAQRTPGNCLTSTKSPIAGITKFLPPFAGAPPPR